MSIDTERRGPTPQAGAGRAAGVAARRGPLLLGALTVAATAYIAAVDPNRPGHYLACPLLTLTGWYCPGCGGLRAVHDLAHLDLAGAWSMNPLLVAVIPLAVVLWGRWFGRAWRPGAGPSVASSRRSSRLAVLALMVLLAYAVARNIPSLALWLAP